MGDSIYVVGGYCHKDKDEKTVEVYNPDTDEWTQVLTLASFFVDFAVIGFKHQAQVQVLSGHLWLQISVSLPENAIQ